MATSPDPQSVCVCVRARARVCVRACACICMRVCMRDPTDCEASVTPDHYPNSLTKDPNRSWCEDGGP